MKFAVVSDVHIGAYHQYKGIYRKNTLYSKQYLEKFVQKMNSAYQPEFVVTCGDMVEDIDIVQDEANYLAGITILSRLKCPVYHVIGNHEQRYLSHGFLRQTIGQPKLYYKIDRDDFRLIFLFTNQPFKAEGGWAIPYLDNEQLEWLRAEVNTDKRIVIFSHASLAPVDTLGNFWFEDSPSLAYIENHRAFLDIIKGKNVEIVINGHLHWNKRQKVNGVNYVTVQSLVENTSGKIKGPPANAYALVEVDNSKVKIDIKGWGGEVYRW